MRRNLNTLWAGLLLAVFFVTSLLFVLIAFSPAAKAAEEPATATAYFAGGCFWCMEPPFDKQPGVISTTSGYMGGQVANPSYEEVSAGTTGHAEVVRVIYDPGKVNYGTLLDIFWRNVDPLDAGGQFCDRGDQYRSEIFVTGSDQRRAAEQSRERISRGPLQGKEIATAIADAGAFYPAEEYHQDYYLKNPLRYKFYKFSCGRDGRLEEVWGES